MKFFIRTAFTLLPTSPPARGAWIEMTSSNKLWIGVGVAPREGGVD